MIRLLSISCFSRLARLPQFEKGRVNSNFDRFHFPGNLRWFGIDIGCGYNWPCACVFVCVRVRVTVRAKHSVANETLHRKHPNLARRPWAKNVAQLHCLIRIATVESVSNFFLQLQVWREASCKSCGHLPELLFHGRFSMIDFVKHTSKQAGPQHPNLVRRPMSAISFHVGFWIYTKLI